MIFSAKETGTKLKKNTIKLNLIAKHRRAWIHFIIHRRFRFVLRSTFLKRDVTVIRSCYASNFIANMVRNMLSKNVPSLTYKRNIKRNKKLTWDWGITECSISLMSFKKSNVSTIVYKNGTKSAYGWHLV